MPKIKALRKWSDIQVTRRDRWNKKGMPTHLMDRISPKGHEFFGECHWCGQRGLAYLAQHPCSQAPAIESNVGVKPQGRECKMPWWA